MKRVLAAGLLAVLAVTGCAGGGDATARAEKLAGEIAGATVIALTAENDTYGRLDEEKAPLSVAAIHLPGRDCATPGFICGAEVEVRPGNAEEVAEVAAYTQAIAIDNGMPVDTWVDGTTVLTIDTRIDPIDQAALVAAFGGVPALAA